MRFNSILLSKNSLVRALILFFAIVVLLFSYDTHAQSVTQNTQSSLEAQIQLLMQQIALLQANRPNTGNLFKVTQNQGIAIEQGGEETEFAGMDIYAQSQDTYMNSVTVHVRVVSGDRSAKPWETFKSGSLWVNGGPKVGDVDLSSYKAWTTVSRSRGVTTYAVRVFSGNLKIPANTRKELTAALTPTDTASVDTVWDISIPARGIVTWTPSRGNRFHSAIPNVAQVTVVERPEEGIQVEAYLNDSKVSIVPNQNGDAARFLLSYHVSASGDDVYVLDPVSSGRIFNDRNEEPKKLVVSGSTFSTAEEITDAKGARLYRVSDGSTDAFELTMVANGLSEVGRYNLRLEDILYRVSPDGITKSLADTNSELVNDLQTRYLLWNPTTTPTATLTQSATTTAVSEPFLLSWSSTNARSCTLDKISPSGPKVNFATSLNGSRGVAPARVDTHTWELICTGAGGSVTRRLSHIVVSATSTTATSTGQQVTNGVLSVLVDPVPRAQTFSPGSVAGHVARYWLDGIALGEGVQVTSIPLRATVANNVAANNTAINLFSSCQLWDSFTPLNTGRNLVNPTTVGNIVFNFDTPITLQKGATKILDLRCNISNFAPSGSTFSWGISEGSLTRVTGVTSGRDVQMLGNGALGQRHTVIGLLLSPTSTNPATSTRQGVTTTTQLKSATNAQRVVNAFGYQDILPSTVGYRFTQDLFRGESGAEVLALQKILAEIGIYKGEITGNFLDQTSEAVRKFQAEYGIKVTGYVGAVTREKLNTLIGA